MIYYYHIYITLLTIENLLLLDLFFSFTKLCRIVHHIYADNSQIYLTLKWLCCYRLTEISYLLSQKRLNTKIAKIQHICSKS